MTEMTAEGIAQLPAGFDAPEPLPLGPEPGSQPEALYEDLEEEEDDLEEIEDLDDDEFEEIEEVDDDVDDDFDLDDGYPEDEDDGLYEEDDIEDDEDLGEEEEDDDLYDEDLEDAAAPEVELSPEAEEELLGCLSIRDACDLMDSEISGIYDEISRLCESSPRDRATRLQVEAINRDIARCRDLFDTDPVVQEIEPFAISRSLPQYRDVVIILRQLLQAIDRFREGRGAYLWTDEFDRMCLAAGVDEDEVPDFFGIDEDASA